MPGTNDVIEKAINTIRFLSADAVQKANSGHPGLPMGMAAIGYTIFTRHLRHNPKNPQWFNRDRFVLSGGHGSMLLYSLLHLTGYDLSLEDVQSFRQLGSRTPGHPEYGLTPGVETTTGPLGQGFANGVGMAITEAHLAARFNQENWDLIDHQVYVIVTDGDLMEGVSSEAASLAGHLKLGKLIYLYDDNRISIDGSTDLSFTEDRGKRFEAYGWHVSYVSDGNGVQEIDTAIQTAKADPRPSLIICRTYIGYGMPNKQDTAEAHGEPPGEAELEAAKYNLGWPLEPKFFLPEEVEEHFKQVVNTGEELEAAWSTQLAAYSGAFPALADELKRLIKGELPSDWGNELLSFPADVKGMATRVSSGKVVNSLAERIPELIGGSADLAPSNKTWLAGHGAIQAGYYGERNMHFGVREHAMGAILNGMALHGGVIPYGGTFMVFSDYMRGSLRISALSKIPSIFIFTHDSIGVGEDGPTHQPVEHLAALRAIPGFVVIRPGDANEVSEAWRIAIERRNGPTALALSRQSVTTLDREIFTTAQELRRGAYVLADLGEEGPELILMASGSEVDLIVEAGLRLAAESVNVRLVSFPSWELFKAQPASYRESVLPDKLRARVAVEAGVDQGWEKWVGLDGAIIAMQGFGVSAPGNEAMRKFGFTADNVIETALKVLKSQFS